MSESDLNKIWVRSELSWDDEDWTSSSWYWHWDITHDNTCDSLTIELTRWYSLSAYSQLFRRWKDFQVEKWSFQSM